MRDNNRFNFLNLGEVMMNRDRMDESKSRREARERQSEQDEQDRRRGFQQREQAAQLQHQSAQYRSQYIDGDNQALNELAKIDLNGAMEIRKFMKDNDGEGAKAFKQSLEMIGNGAMMSDTPEKWDQLIGSLSRRGVDVSEFESFESRERAISIAGLTKEAMDVEIGKRPKQETYGQPVAGINPETGADQFVRYGSQGGSQPVTGQIPRKAASAVSLNLATAKPIGSKALQWVDEKGNNPPPSMSLEEVYENYKPVSSGALSSGEDAAKALPAVTHIIDVSMGSGDPEMSLFPSQSEALRSGDAGTGEYLADMASRLVKGGASYAEAKTKSDEATVLYQAGKESMLAKIARLNGHTGVLTQPDVDSVKKLFPTPGLTPYGTAQSQFKQIAVMLKGMGVSERDILSIGIPAWTLEARTKKNSASGSQGIARKQEGSRPPLSSFMGVQ